MQSCFQTLLSNATCAATPRREFRLEVAAEEAAAEEAESLARVEMAGMIRMGAMAEVMGALRPSGGGRHTFPRRRQQGPSVCSRRAEAEEGAEED